MSRKATRRRKVWALCDPINRAMSLAATLTPAQVAAVMLPYLRAMEALRAGTFSEGHWRELADAANLAQALAELNLCNDHDAKFQAAQRALQAIAFRHATKGSWTPYGAELVALAEALEIHEIQLSVCSVAEAERALNRVRNLVSQALAGNAGGDVVIVDRAAA